MISFKRYIIELKLLKMIPEPDPKPKKFKLKFNPKSRVSDPPELSLAAKPRPANSKPSAANQKLRDELKQNGLLLKDATKQQQNNRDLVVIALENNGLALEFASDDIRKNYSLVAKAVNNNPEAFKFAHSSLIYYPHFLSSIKINQSELFKYLQRKPTLKNAAYEVKANAEVVKQIIKHDGLELQYANNSFRNNENIVRLAMENNPKALELATPKVQRKINLLK